jgi:excinuclease UvrABC ATPase subunit
LKSHLPIVFVQQSFWRLPGTCEGFSMVLGIDEDLVIPNKLLSVYEGAVAPWKGEKLGAGATVL